MRKLFITIGTLLLLINIPFSLEAQSPDDALRYSQRFYSGTSRFNSMGGAFTALGGDLSSLGLNPAGLAVFRRSEISFTPHISYNNSSSFFTDRGEDFRYNLSAGQFGIAVPVVVTGSESGHVSTVFGYSYSQTNNYNANIVIRGVKSNSSMADFWADASNGILWENLGGSAGRAFDAWLIDTIAGGGGTTYATIFSRYGEETQSTYGQSVRRVIQNEGYAGDHTFSLAVNYGNNLFAGAALSLSRFNYTGHYEHIEHDDQGAIFDFKSFSFVDHFEATGTGYSLRAGLIYLPLDFVRLGLSLHTPTIFRVKEYYHDDIVSTFDNGDMYEFSSDAFRFEYRLTTPFRVLTGAAVQIDRSATISLDYEFVDYSITRFSNASDNYDYFDENQSIRDIFAPAHNIRAGLEYRLGNIYLRGGYGFYGSGFHPDEPNSDWSYSSYSGGIGVRQASFYLDFGYTRLSSSQKYFMYSHPDLDAATIDNTRNNFTVTAGVRF